ncbi:MAG: c-type cytochrome biogenesis protein CcmI [Betaproteobacteria bacterium]|nr:c-type cytochrome biogenesis protein CcmI [Betaproteobacteria bacterium]
MSISFLIAAALLALLALAWLLRPLLVSRTADSGASRQALNTTIYRDQLAELERDRAADSIAVADFEQARTELQRRMLQDAAVADETPAASATLRPARSTALALVLLLPLSAGLLYAWLGNPAAMRPVVAQRQVTAAQIDEMVNKLAARLEKNPQDTQGWAMLGRSYKALGRYDEAEKAFARAGDAVNNDPALLTEYADLLAARTNSLEGKPMQLVQRALQLDPTNIMALALAGTAAYNRQDFPEATRYWEILLKKLPPESEDAKGLTATLAEIRGKSAGPVAKSGMAKPAQAASAKSVSGSVTLAPALAGKVQPGDTLFVYARPAEGSRMPLAVLRVKAGDLPMTFTLDDSQAMRPDLKLSDAAQVMIEARVSKSGQAIPQPGDLIGVSGPVKPGAKGVKLSIDRINQ